MPTDQSRPDPVTPDPDSQAEIDRRYRLLVEGVSEYAIFILDLDGIVRTWNLGAERIKGYRADEIIGQHFSRFYPQPEIDERWPQRELEIVLGEGRFETEGWRLRKDGSRFWASVLITRLEDQGRPIGFSKITRDLTVRRQNEEDLRASEERFRLLVEGVQDYAIFMLDPEGRVVTWNVGAQRIKGYRASEILGRHFSTFYPADAIDRGWPEHELAVASREGRFEDEGWRLRRDGSRFWANVIITALFDSYGGLRGFAKVTRDLTERRKIENLEASGRRISEFIAMLGHELRNPLAPIRNAIAVLRSDDQIRGQSGTWAQEVIERQVGHLTRLVDDLLDVSRINTGKVSVQRQPVDLGGVVKGTVDSVQALFDGKRQRVSVRLPSSPLRVSGDPTRLSQIVLNLLTNAHKYTPAGGHVEIELDRDGRFAQLRVRDDGVGIVPELLPHVFDLFVQGDRNLDRSEGGLGIGLTLVRKLIELHGGTVTASSAGLGRGTEFLLRLPILLESPVAGVAVDSAPAPAPRSLRVLVVDDNQDSAESLAMLLGLWSHQARTAVDGRGALEEAATWNPDIVLLDIGLPGMNGYEVAAALRPSHSVLIAMTGYGRPEDQDRAKAAGFAEHLVKPVDPVRLQKLLSELAPDAR